MLTYLVVWYERDGDQLVSEWEVLADQLDSVKKIVNPPDDLQCMPLPHEQVDELAKIMGFPVDLGQYEYFLECQQLFQWTPKDKV